MKKTGSSSLSDLLFLLGGGRGGKGKRICLLLSAEKGCRLVKKVESLSQQNLVDHDVCVYTFFDKIVLEM
jgi:hypothetical protein